MSADHQTWLLFNASPDIRSQITDFPALHPGPGRRTPIAAVLLTDAEIDHTLGLLLMREGRGVTLHATASAHKTLSDGTGILRTLEHYCPVDWRPVVPGEDVELADGLRYRAFDVPTVKRARFATDSWGADEYGRVVGYRLTDTRTGRVAVYLPGVQDLNTVAEQLDGCDCLFLDGTCWHDDELIRLGLAEKTAHQMGHQHLGGPGGSLERIAGLPIGRKIYIHINNTNPILLDDSPERQAVADRGVEVAVDGLEVEI